MKKLALYLSALVMAAAMSAAFAPSAQAETSGTRCLQFGAGGKTANNTCKHLVYYAWCIHNPTRPYQTGDTDGQPPCEAGQVFSSTIEAMGSTQFGANGAKVGDGIAWAECHSPYEADRPGNMFDPKYDVARDRVVTECIFAFKAPSGKTLIAKGSYSGSLKLP